MATFKDNIWKMYLFQFLAHMHFMGGVLIPFFLDWGGITYFQIMILQSIFVFSMFILEIPTGAVADYLGRKTSLIMCAVLVSMSGLVYGFFPGFWFFVIAEVLWAAGGALLSGADQALVYDSLKKIKSEKQSKKIFGRVSSFRLGAIMVAGLMGSVIAATFGLRYTAMFMAIPMFLAVFVALSFKEPKTTKKIESKRYLDTLVSGVKFFKNHSTLKILAFDAISIGALTFMLIWTYQLVLRDMNVPILYYGLFHATICLGQIAVYNNFERLDKLFGSKKNYIFGSALITGASFMILGINTYLSVVVILLFMIGAFGLTRQALFHNYMNKHVESHNRATVLSTVSMLYRFTSGLMYPFLGLAVEASLTFTLIVIGILIIVAAIISRVEEEHLLD